MRSSRASSAASGRIPHGLNGFLLLLHIGAGPKRTDKFHTRFGELLDDLAGKGYQFVRVDELLETEQEGSMIPATRAKQPPEVRSLRFEGDRGTE